MNISNLETCGKQIKSNSKQDTKLIDLRSYCDTNLKDKSTNKPAISISNKSINLQISSKKYSKTMHLNKVLTLKRSSVFDRTQDANMKLRTEFSTSKIIKFEAKFCLYLVILLSAILFQTSNAIPVQASGQRLTLHTQQYRERRYQQLLQEQRSLVVPTPHRHHLHHRSVGNMPQTNSQSEDTGANGNDIGDYCRAIEPMKKLLRQALDQANVTFCGIYHSLPRYTHARHNEKPENFYEQWSKHKLELEHPYREYLNRNITVMPQKSSPDPVHLSGVELTNETIAKEFQNINQTLKILESVYEEVMEWRKKNRAQIRFELQRENEPVEEFNERLRIIDEMYSKVMRFLKQDLFHTREILNELKIPPQDDFPVVYNRDVQEREWLIFQEHLSLMKLLIESYTYLLEHCNRTS